MTWTIQDRRTSDTSSLAEHGVPTEHWPWAIHDDSRGVGFGAVVALVHGKEDAEMILAAIEDPASAITQALESAARQVLGSAGQCECGGECELDCPEDCTEHSHHDKDCAWYWVAKHTRIVRGESK